MTKQSSKQKHDKLRAEKRKHEQLTEHMHEEAAKKKRAHREEIGAIIVLLIFVPFMISGVIWWPASSSSAGARGGISLTNGNYKATYMSSRPASVSNGAVAVLDVYGESIIVNEQDLSGDAVKNSSAFFNGKPGTPVEITVKNGYITGWSAAPAA